MSLAIPVSATDHAQGSPEAAVTLVEYGDYQCPYCGLAYHEIKKAQKRLGAKLRFVFRNFPLNQAHPQAELAAESAEAAGAQGKFWEMHDALYENQQQLGQPLIEALVERLRLDGEKFEADLETRKFQSHVKHDFMGGVRSGVNGTPGLFINGQRYDGSWEEQPLTDALLKAAAAAGA
ncbi:MAG TPA: thioredoxin domain-containing protein [Steroidobacteraceae bacterium]|nr:thioredoxin domain-containing protein [Steroidobacteraceae bacterium]